MMILMTGSNLLSQNRNAFTIQNSRTQIILITPEVYQNPKSYKVYLPGQIDFPNITFTLYHHTGVKVIEKQLDLAEPINSISLDMILKESKWLPSGYYFYETRKLYYARTSAPQSDSLTFRYVSNTHLPTDSTFGGYSEFVDLNGDLQLDIITGFSALEFQQPRLLINEGNGQFIDETFSRLPQIEFHTFDLAVFDADSDGDLDLFFAAEDTHATNPIQNGDKLFLNDGSGFFNDVSETHLPKLNNFSGNVDWGFVNNDLFPDLLISGFGIGAGVSEPFRTPLFVLINDGSGHFEDQSSTYLPETLPLYGVFDAALTDINGDALIDIVMANFGLTITDETSPEPIAVFSGQNAVLIQNSNNQFVDETTARMPEDNDDGLLIKVTDVNNDNAPDLYVINFSFFTDQHQELYLNDGSGVFQDVTSERLPQQNITFLNDVEFRDFDGNGYVDMYLVNNMLGGATTDFLSLNENGVFIDASDNLPSIIDVGLTVTSGDIDKDGDFDIFVSTTSSSNAREGAPDKLLENLSIVVSVSQPPTVQPSYFQLSQNYPNPFNPSTTILYTIPESLNGRLVTLVMYNSLGQKVRTLLQAIKSVGVHQIRWDGKDDQGTQVAGGVYVYRLTVDTFTEARKLLFLR